MTRRKELVPNRIRPEKKKCHVIKRSGEQCKNWAIHGANVCGMHGGRLPSVKEHAKGVIKERYISNAAKHFGVPTDIDPVTALIKELRRSDGVILWIEEQIQQLSIEQLPVSIEVETRQGTGEENRHIDETTRRIVAEPNVWVRLWQTERQHQASLASTMVKLDLHAKELRIRQDEVELLANAMRAALTMANIPEKLQTDILIDTANRLALSRGNTSDE